MIIKRYIQEFENLGLGLFVHFGLYSLVGKGEWAKNNLNMSEQEYEQTLPQQFQPRPDWARQLAKAAKAAGCRYITLTTRHHDGFSLYDTCGLNTYDAPHSCGRDLVREFVDACREQRLIPFFYHTLLDWHEPTFEADFPAYLEYLRKSVELLCSRYGTIGGLWFDGAWSKPDSDWEEDALYGMIRRYQPEAMIINNTGLWAQGQLGHIELDSVTFERGKPFAINMEGAPKYVASEMCQVFCDHWGYAREDLNYKAPADMIRDLVSCRRYGSNLLINVGPMGDGSLRPLDACMLDLMGQWVGINHEAIYRPKPTGVEIEGHPDDFLLRDGDTYYLFCDHLPMLGDINVTRFSDADYQIPFSLDRPIRSMVWLDNGEPVSYTQEDGRVVVEAVPYTYGRNLVVRVVKIETEHPAVSD